METRGKDSALHPRLCERCQAWRSLGPRVDHLGLRWYNLTYDHYANEHCLICMHVFSAANTRIADSGHQAILPSRLAVRVIPLNIFNYSHVDSVASLQLQRIQEKRIEHGLPLGIWLKLAISVEPEPESDSTVLVLVLRLLAYYTRHGTLFNIEDGDVPYFDISTLKGWLQFCDEHHGVRCTGGTETTETPILHSNSSIRNNVMEIITRPTAISKFAQKIHRRFSTSQPIQSPPPSKGVPDDFRLIDTHSSCIVKPYKPTPFVALSYMWSPGGTDSSDIKLEKANISLLETPGALTANKLPKLILHAISLCRMLGEQFLWVDRLCIVQDDCESKSAQIETMDLVYRSASFTIIAALDSRTTDMGLPGHPEQARLPLSSGLIPLTPYNTQPTLSGMNVVNQSMWNRRGWTFQEQLLSKRRLFITEYEVIFQCSLAEAEENFTWDRGCFNLRSTDGTSMKSIDESPYPLSPAEPGVCMPGHVEEWYEKIITTQVWHTDMTTLKGYKALVEEYSTRQLSVETDILNAFRGVANTIAAGLGSRMLFGIPENYLSQCLLWACEGQPVRRGDVVAIPSWSWASCAKPVKYGHIENKYGYIKDDEEENTCSIVQYYYQDPEEGIRKLTTEQRWMDSKTTISKIAKGKKLPPTKWDNDTLEEAQSNRTWRGCVHNPWQAASHSVLDPNATGLAAQFPGSLVFNTTVASLCVRSSSEAAGEVLGFDNATIHNAQGDKVGCLVNMNFHRIGASEGSEGVENVFDFIVLDGHMETHKHLKWGFDWGLFNDKWHLAVMLVERLQNKPFIARRVCIGTIAVCAWNTCNPRWETVILC